MGYTDSAYKKLYSLLNNKPVWGLEFYKGFAFIGSRFSGLYVWDLNKQEITQHFDSSEIGLCRRIRVINDSVYLISRKGLFTLHYVTGIWKLNKLTSDIPNTAFFTDVAIWNNRMYATAYDDDGNKKNLAASYAIKNKLTTDTIAISFGGFYKNYIQKQSSISVLAALSIFSTTYPNSSMLVCGSSYSLFNNKREIECKTLISPTQKKLPVWDITYAKNKYFLAIGNPDNNQEGMIYETGRSSLEDLNSNFYGQCLYFDDDANAMWMGTLNRGIFYWPFIGESYKVPKEFKDDYNFKIISKDEILFYNKTKVVLQNIRNNTEKKIYQTPNNSDFDFIRDLIQSRDTTIIMSSKKIIQVVYKNGILHQSEYNFEKSVSGKDLSNFIYKNGNNIYRFSIFFNTIRKLNLSTKKETLIKSASNQVKGIPYKNNLLYFSTYAGFHYFDSISHPFDIHLPAIESFITVSDTLWTLNGSAIKTFKIDLVHYKLIPLFEYDIKDAIGSNLPTWISSFRGNILCGNHQGYFTLNNKTSEPIAYNYLGNYSKGKFQLSDSTGIYYNYDNYVTRICEPTAYKIVNPSQINISIYPNNSINLYTPFRLNFNANDFIVQNHSLKKIVFNKSNKIYKKVYTLNDHYDFSLGMEQGNYQIEIYINNHLIATQNLKITIPLSSNPIFYIGLLVLLVSLLIILFKLFLDKKKYKQSVLENRLQLLKQNLNPHFIFNSLNLIYSLVLQNKNDVAIKNINHFSDLHHYYLNNINKQRITLEEEFEFIESYLKLEAARIAADNPFEYELPDKIEEKFKKLLVPPMILQPLVENSIKYCGKTIDSKNYIWIDTYVKDNRLFIGIENTIGNINENLIRSSKMGIKLVNERVEIFNKMYGENILFLANVNCKYAQNGYRCEISFPLNFSVKYVDSSIIENRNP